MPIAALSRCLAAVTVMALLGCSRHGGQAGTERAGPDQAHSPAQRPASSTLAIAGRLMDGGADQGTLRAYLQTVKELKPKKFAVQWSPDTVAVSRDEAMRSLRAVNEDGSLFTFASSDPVVSRLQPGRIVWIWDIAIRRIDHVARLGDVTIVHTKPVALTEALAQSDIEFESPVDFANAYGTLRPHLPKQPAPQKTSRMHVRSPYQLVAMHPGDPETPPPPPPNGDENAAPNDDESDDYGLVAATQGGTTGRLAGFEYSLGYTVFPSHVTFEIQARKEEEEGGSGESNEIHRDQRDEFFELVKERREAMHEQRITYSRIFQLDQQLNAAEQHAAANVANGSTNSLVYTLLEQREKAIKEYNKWLQEAEEDETKIKALAAAGALAKQVFYVISDNLDVRFRAKMDLDRASFSGAIQTGAGALKQFAARFNDMNGRIDLEAVARLGKPGNGGVSVPVVNIPVVMNIPVPVEGIPLVVQFAADFLVKVGVSGNHATQHWVGHFKFGQGLGLHADASQSQGEGGLSSEEPVVEEKTAESPGTSALVLAVQLPRFGLGVGMLGSSGMAYMDLVSVLTLLNSASVAALNPQCKRFTLDRVGSVGVDVSVVPIPIPLVQSAANKALSQRKEVWRAAQWKLVEPDIKMCHVGSGD